VVSHFISILNFDWLKIEACFIQIQLLLDMEEKLIEQVRLHEVLYNYKLTSYRDQHSDLFFFCSLITIKAATFSKSYSQSEELVELAHSILNESQYIV
jgi:hypothetical protein